MKLSPKQRQFAVIGGWVFTAAAAFAFGRMTNWLDAPVTPAAQSANHAGGSAGGASGSNGPGGQGNSALEGRVGGSFGADDTAGGGHPTVAQITGNQPLEDWLKKLMEQDDDIIRTKNFMRLIEALDDPDDIKTALKVLGEGRNGRGNRGPGGFGGGRFSEYGMLMEKLTQKDPKVAMAYAADQKGGEKFMATSTAMRSWARMDPAAALTWAQTEGVNLQMDFGGGGRGPGGTGGAADGQDGQPKENFALMTVLSQIAKTDIDKAMSTASTAEIGRMGDRMVSTLADEMISQRGADAARKALDTMPAGDFRDQYIQQLARQLSGKDAAGTADWVNSLPTGDAKRRALGSAIGEWAQEDPNAAGIYLSKLPASTDTDSARERYAQTVSRENPSSALMWAATITDPQRRESAQATLISDWTRRDAPAAQQWIAQSDLSPEMKTQLSQPQNRRNTGGGPGGFTTGGGGGFRRGGGNGGR